MNCDKHHDSSLGIKHVTFNIQDTIDAGLTSIDMLNYNGTLIYSCIKNGVQFHCVG